MKPIIKKASLEFLIPDAGQPLGLPLFTSKVSAGFPSPAEDYVDKNLDLNQYIVKHPAATFYIRVSGNSMEGAGIFNGDLLVIDRALEAKSNDIAVCVLNGEFTVKRILKKKDGLYLVPENPDFKPLKIAEEADFQIWGIVSYIIHKV
ncbi:MAG: peptidase S24 [Bacteroidetes bacterium RIFOXYA12_FULL_35_11]|nr:MAG: peptidase S24 [Bacteroidetes bacterium GWF2_35_48]OFY73431.1 MAG: peptidase S24 [Bacteroidetes bacterium RIFOXYA12_FULL_35_11]OFY94985.1 MAG: peptidase S24 [Bacteroidetes bacterium RIFOXYC12_FULL_35_7]HBX51272.1 peptidase S24 [Bacteroidales bacterium]